MTLKYLSTDQRGLVVLVPPRLDRSKFAWRGVKFVPLKHQKQTWGLKFDTGLGL